MLTSNTGKLIEESQKTRSLYLVHIWKLPSLVIIFIFIIYIFVNNFILFMAVLIKQRIFCKLFCTKIKV